MEIERMTEIETPNIQIGDQIRVDHYMRGEQDERFNQQTGGD